MTDAAFSSLIDSSDLYDGTDDRLKDEDSGWWVMRLPPAVRAEWLTTLRWVRAPDRLLEGSTFDDATTGSAFEGFVADWRRVRNGEEPRGGRFRGLFVSLAERWRRDSVTEQSLRQWDLYLDALWRYRYPDQAILTMDDYRRAMYELSGTFFQALPYQPPGLNAEVGALGALDQFYNNLRDFSEDILRGINYFPHELLDRFGIDRDELVELLGQVDERLERLQEYLLASVVPEWRQQAAPLLSATGLHDSWRELLHSVMTRHSRIEYAARFCRFNARHFQAVYWPLAAEDIRRERGDHTVPPVASRPAREPEPAAAPPFHLAGNFAPVSEEITAFDLAVDGSIPRELRGRYLRNGPNPKTGDSPHWFFGDGMIHGIELRDGRATWYRNRWVKTKGLRDGQARLSEDGTVDLANTHVFVHAGRIFALMETSFPTEITSDLDTLGECDFDGRLGTTMTAHPKRCPRTGEMHFFGYGFLPPYLTYHRVDRHGTLVQTEVIDVPGPTMIHDFCLTENFVVFLDLPVVLEFDLVFKGTMPFRWSDDYGARVGILPRGGAAADIRWYEVDPCYAFHVLNGFDDGDSVVIDTVRYRELWRETSTRFEPASLHRWTIERSTGKVREDGLDDRPVEFPRTDDRRTGRPYRYGYTLEMKSFDDCGPLGSSALFKHDFRTGAVETHDFGSGRMPAEGVFVPASAGAGEDEGYVMTLVYDPSRNLSDFVILDASDFRSPPLATVALPRRVPFGFHGNWVDDETVTG